MNEKRQAELLLGLAGDVKNIASAGADMAKGCELLNQMLAINMRLTCYLLLRALGTLDIDVVVGEVNALPVDGAVTEAIYKGMGIDMSREVH